MIRSLIVMTAALFAAVIPVVAVADPLRPPDGTYRYELRIAGAVAGQSTVVVREGADAFVVDDDSRFTALNNPATFVVDALDIPAQSIEFRLVDPIASDRSLRDGPPAP